MKQRHRRRRQRRKLGLESLERRTLLAADPMISEFLAANRNVLNDGDRESSDWIEIYNRGDEPANLQGWYLTDDERELTKWTFPETMVAPDDYLVVFASGKNDVDSRGNLHTNFRLSSRGEYLALVQPDGQTIATEFSPQFPAQLTDISYGIRMEDRQVDLVSADSPAQYLVPTDNGLADTWTRADFVPDATWTTAGDDGTPIRAAVGFENDSGFAPHFATDIGERMRGINGSLYLRVPFSIADPNAIDELTLEMKYDDGYLVYLNGNILDLKNAPLFKSFDSTALQARSNAEAIVPESTDLSEFLGALQPGENVLAIHAVNVSADDDDFLVSPRLSTSSLHVDDQSSGYFSEPTPGEQNAGAFSLGPRIDAVQHAPQEPAAGEALVVTAQVSETIHEISAVELVYRVMYDDEVRLVMRDDGAGADSVAGDAVYTAVIPADVGSPGQMLRYYVSVTDAEANSMQSPRRVDTTGRDQSPEYYGTVVSDPELTSNLPILQWFSENERRARTRGGARASVFYQGEFYDNIFVRQRGGATNNTSQKFNFNDDQPFYVNEEIGRVAEFNMNAQGADPSYLRQTLAFDSYTWAGNESSASFLVLMRVNGDRDRVGVFIEQVDESFLQRHGLDPNGALYKFVQRSNLDPVFSDTTTGIEKKIPQDNDLSDIREVVDGLTQADREDRAKSVFDHFNLAQLMNFLAVRSITMDADDVRKNFYLYQDTFGTGQWSIFPWDKDWTFGIQGDGGPGLPHPFFGDEERRKPNANQWNRLYDTVFNDPVLSEMFLRRLRTVMDQVLQSPETRAEDGFYEQRIDQMLAAAVPDLPSSAVRQVDSLKRFFTTRRNTLYNEHSIDLLNDEPVSDIIPEFATGVRYFVPTNNDLGTSWTGINEPVNIADWNTGQAGFGFEARDRYTEQLRTIVNPQESCAECTSIYLRLVFDVEDVAAVNALTLRMKYEDAFIAYINGTEVARANYEGNPSYDGEASRSNSSSRATEFENFLIRNHLDLLRPGRNVLAIHSINRSATNDDQMILPVLVNGVISDSSAAGIPNEQVGNPTIRFGEFSHNPASGNQDEEYIQLVNSHDTAVDISGWQLTGGVEHTFPAGTVIPSHGSMYVTPSTQAFLARMNGPRGGQGLFVQGNYRGHLSNFGEIVRLVAGDGTFVDQLTTPFEPTNVQRYLRVSEVHYNPPGQGDETEFIEFVNTSQGNEAVTLDLSGVTIAQGPATPFTFADGLNLPAGQRVVVVKDRVAFQAAYPNVDETQIAGPFVGSLSNAGERIKVNDRQGGTIDDLTYRDGPLWPQRADGAGASLERFDGHMSDGNKSYHWRASTEFGGSPGRDGTLPPPIVINEVVTSSDGPTDAIELVNLGNVPVDLSGWYLSDSADDLLKYAFPAGTVIAAGGYHVVREREFNPQPPGEANFALNGTSGDDVWLVRSEQGQIASFVDDVHFGATEIGTSLGRFPDSSGPLLTLSAPTLGSPNTGIRAGNVVITELHYHPDEPIEAARQIHAPINSDDLEFVELYNATASAVDLTGWRIRGGIDFDFPQGSRLDPGQTILVTPFNPDRSDNRLRTLAFRTHYALSDDAVLVGGYAGTLSNSQDLVRLERPLAPVGEIVPPVTEDEVAYDDQSPWPLLADGMGASLQRATAALPGREVSNWISGAPTPGQFSARSGDLDNDGQVGAADIDRLCQAIDEGDASFDLNQSGAVNEEDLEFFVQQILRTSAGDANLDRVFDSGDLVRVFQAGEYEDGLTRNSSWSEGDWNCDREFDSGDLVAAFKAGAFAVGTRRR